MLLLASSRTSWIRFLRKACASSSLVLDCHFRRPSSNVVASSDPERVAIGVLLPVERLLVLISLDPCQNDSLDAEVVESHVLEGD